MEYCLTDTGVLYYRSVDSIFWLKYTDDELSDMMMRDKALAHQGMDEMVSFMLDSPNAHVFQIIEWQYQRMREIREYYDPLNMAQYKYDLFMNLTQNM